MGFTDFYIDYDWEVEGFTNELKMLVKERLQSSSAEIDNTRISTVFSRPYRIEFCTEKINRKNFEMTFWKLVTLLSLLVLSLASCGTEGPAGPGSPIPAVETRVDNLFQPAVHL